VAGMWLGLTREGSHSLIMTLRYEKQVTSQETPI
jgi:hypothetical protein